MSKMKLFQLFHLSLLCVIFPPQSSTALHSPNQYGMEKQSQDGHISVIWRMIVSCSVLVRSFRVGADGPQNDTSRLLDNLKGFQVKDQGFCFIIFSDISNWLHKVEIGKTEDSQQRVETVIRIHTRSFLDFGHCATLNLSCQLCLISGSVSLSSLLNTHVMLSNFRQCLHPSLPSLWIVRCAFQGHTVT